MLIFSNYYNETKSEVKDKTRKESKTPQEPSDKGEFERPDQSNRPDRVAYILIAITVLAHVIFFLPFQGVTTNVPKVGDISTEEVIAPFNFTVYKSDEELEREKRTVRLNVPVILDFSAEIGDSALNEFDSLWASALPFIEKKSIPGRADSIRLYFPWLSEENAQTLAEFRKVANVRQNVRELLSEIFSSGVFSWGSMAEDDTAHLFNIRRGRQEEIIPSERVITLEDAKQKLENRSMERFSDYPEKGKVVFNLARGLIRPNLIPDMEETNANRKEAVEDVKKDLGKVQKDQRIVDAHERITEEIHQKLESLAKAKSGKYQTTPSVFSALTVMGRLLLTLLVVVIFAYLIKSKYERTWRDPAKLAVLMMSIWLPGLFAFIFRLAGWPELLTPMAFSATLLAVLFGTQLSILGVVAASLLLAFAGESSASFLVVMIVEGTVAAEMFANVAQRRQSIKPILFTVLASLIAVSLMDFVSFGEFGEMATKVLSVAAGSIFGPLLAIALIPVFERVVGIVTDFTLLEYANTNAPVLQQLAIEAPGTYHHSMVVGNLAESAAEAIGANPLLAKVGGLYHDIGKLTHPEYFSENLSDENPHDKLSPHMSFLVLSAHVKEGVRLAKIHDIPKAIIDIMREHHGNDAMKYFYDQAKSNDPSVTEEAFRYPGPKPQTREAAIVMLADGVEARIRSMDKIDSNVLKKVIKKTIDDKFESGQLADTELTTRDLNKIAESFATIMEGVLHRRPSLEMEDVESVYPEPKENE